MKHLRIDVPVSCLRLWALAVVMLSPMASLAGAQEPFTLTDAQLAGVVSGDGYRGSEDTPNHHFGLLGNAPCGALCSPYLSQPKQESASGPPTPVRVLQVDVIGEVHFSRFNFTDLKSPYNGVDGFTVLRAAVWLDSAHRVGAFGDVIPVVATASEFFFQRYVQGGIGVQVYPIGIPSSGDEDVTRARRLLRPLRMFAQLSGRGYYDSHPDAHLESQDVQIGLDYYWDNLFEDSRLKAFAFTAMGYHTTNFSFEGYDGVVWIGNVKVGPALGAGQNWRVVPYAVGDWTSAPSHGDRFFENFVRVGGGVRWYPQVGQAGGFGTDLVRRLHFYAEAVRNVAWLGNGPPSVVKSADYRVGLAFATGGIYRERR